MAIGWEAEPDRQRRDTWQTAREVVQHALHGVCSEVPQWASSASPADSLPHLRSRLHPDRLYGMGHAVQPAVSLPPADAAAAAAAGGGGREESAGMPWSLIACSGSATAASSWRQYVWRPATQSLHCIRLQTAYKCADVDVGADADSGGAGAENGSTAEESFSALHKEVVLQPPLPPDNGNNSGYANEWEVRQLHLSASGHTLLLVGPHVVAAVDVSRGTRLRGGRADTRAHAWRVLIGPNNERSTSGGHSSGSGSGVTVVQASWHPLSSTHVAVLLSDNTFRLYDVASSSTSAEAEFVLQPGAEHGHGLASCTAFAFGGDHIWERVTVHFLFSDGSIFSLCPVLPQNVWLPTWQVDELWADAMVCERDSAGWRQSQLALAWLRQAFPYHTPSAAAAAPSQAVDAAAAGTAAASRVVQASGSVHLTNYSTALQGPAVLLNSSATPQSHSHPNSGMENAPPQASCVGSATAALGDTSTAAAVAAAGSVALAATVVGRDSVLVVGQADGIVRTMVLADEVHPTWNHHPCAVHVHVHAHVRAPHHEPAHDGSHEGEGSNSDDGGIGGGGVAEQRRQRGRVVCFARPPATAASSSRVGASPGRAAAGMGTAEAAAAAAATAGANTEWSGMHPPLLLLGIADLSLSSSSSPPSLPSSPVASLARRDGGERARQQQQQNRWQLRLLTCAAMADVVVVCHTEGVDGIALRWLPFSDAREAQLARKHGLQSQDLFSIWSPTPSAAGGAAPAVVAAALAAASQSDASVVAVAADAQAAVARVQRPVHLLGATTAAAAAAAAVHGDGSEAQTVVVQPATGISAKVLQGPQRSQIEVLSPAAAKAKVSSAEGVKLLHHHWTNLHSTFVQYAHAAYMEIKGRKVELEQQLRQQQLMQSKIQGAVAAAVLRCDRLSQRVDKANHRNADMGERVKRISTKSAALRCDGDGVDGGGGVGVGIDGGGAVGGGVAVGDRQQPLSAAERQIKRELEAMQAHDLPLLSSAAADVQGLASRLQQQQQEPQDDGDSTTSGVFSNEGRQADASARAASTEAAASHLTAAGAAPQARAAAEEEVQQSLQALDRIVRELTSATVAVQSHLDQTRVLR